MFCLQLFFDVIEFFWRYVVEILRNTSDNVHQYYQGSFSSTLFPILQTNLLYTTVSLKVIERVSSNEFLSLPLHQRLVLSLFHPRLRNYSANLFLHILFYQFSLILLKVFAKVIELNPHEFFFHSFKRLYFILLQVALTVIESDYSND